jgi:hypothetical protein
MSTPLLDQCTKIFLYSHYALLTDAPEQGPTEQPWHYLQMKTNEPVYTKQLRISDAHRGAVKHKVLAWLKLGLIQAAPSKFNNPLYTVTDKQGTVRLV